jgi:hypothetical protein
MKISYQNLNFKKIILRLEQTNLFFFRLIRIIRKYILRQVVWTEKVSFSQLGEDLAIQKLVRVCDEKIFLDVGCFHPLKFSNTRLLKENGWKGIHVDASSQSVNILRKTYPKDNSINAIISNTKNLDFKNLQPNEISPTNKVLKANNYNSLIKNLTKESNKQKNIEVLSPRDLYDRCNEHYERQLKTIGFLNLDIEGLELDFFQGWPIDKCIFQFICVENHAGSLEGILKADLHTWLSKRGYRLVWFFKFSTIYEYNLC